MKKIKTALISVSDKKNLKSLLNILKQNKIKIISSGGTYKEIKKLKESDFIISAKTEFSNDEELYGYHDEFNRLEMKGSKYFNAGVMFIDLEKWRKKYEKSGRSYRTLHQD